MEHIVGFIAIMVLLFIYFIPSFVAQNRDHRNRAAIAVANLFLGWTLLGWVICLIWASTANVEGDKQWKSSGESAGFRSRVG